MTIRRLPAFASETEEANWWYDNREKHAERFVQAIREGRAKIGTLSQRIEEAKKATAITLCAEDALKAVMIAQEKGVDVQAYLADLIHNSLKTDLHAISVSMEDGTDDTGTASPEDQPAEQLFQH